MADRNDELMQLKARVAELEARPAGPDLEWLRNSSVFKRAERATRPAFIRLNAIIVLGGMALFFGIPIIYLIFDKLKNG